jgi:hypothetical protein
MILSGFAGVQDQHVDSWAVYDNYPLMQDPKPDLSGSAISVPEWPLTHTWDQRVDSQVIYDNCSLV